MILKVHTYQVEGIIVKADDLTSTSKFFSIYFIESIVSFVIDIFLFIIPRCIVVVIAGGEHLIGVITKVEMCLIFHLLVILIFILIHSSVSLYLVFTLTLPPIARDILTEHALGYLFKTVDMQLPQYRIAKALLTQLSAKHILAFGCLK